MLGVFYELARFQFDIGNYANAAEYLAHYSLLVCCTISARFLLVIFLQSNDNEKLLSALWGKYAAEILTQNWEVAFEDMLRLKNFIDSQLHARCRPCKLIAMTAKYTGSAVQQLQQRAWFIHWSLFVFFNHAKVQSAAASHHPCSHALQGRDSMIDLVLAEPQYTNAVQTVSPHLLRYLTAAVIMCKRRRSVLSDLARVIQQVEYDFHLWKASAEFFAVQESYSYRDPITDLIDCLYVNFDFDGAQAKLGECEAVC